MGLYFVLDADLVLIATVRKLGLFSSLLRVMAAFQAELNQNAHQ